MSTRLGVIVLTFNEEIHLARCLASVGRIADSIYVVDSGSSDATADIARSCGAIVVENPFTSHSRQLQFAMRTFPADVDMMLRLDADEYIDDDLIATIRSIKDSLAGNPASGWLINRRFRFLDRVLRFGGIGGIHIVRLWRAGKATVEDKWMDEHILVDGPITRIATGTIVDHNLKGLRWWSQKHLDYANRERTDFHAFKNRSLSFNSRSKTLYYRFPPLIRPILYFLLRYVLQFGFLDGRAGLVFHLLQGLWYRIIVDLAILGYLDPVDQNASALQAGRAPTASARPPS